MNREVFLSLLALDAYNRGYGQTVVTTDGDTNSGVDELDRRIGTARVSAQSDVDPDTDGVNAGFYAIAYEWNNETVISYRGTNFPDLSNLTVDAALAAWDDIWGGWNFFLGFDRPSQADFARAFYEDVTTLEFRGEPGFVDSLDTDFNIALTGHSLGGALAGYVGARADAFAFVFDPIPFGDVATTDSLSAAFARTVEEFGLGNIPDFESIISTLLEPLALFPGSDVTLEQFVNRLAENILASRPRFESVEGHYLEGELAQQIPTLQTQLGRGLAAVGGSFPGTFVGLLATALGRQQNIQGQINEASSDRLGVTKIGNRGLPSETLLDFSDDSVALHSIAWLTLILFGEKQWAPTDGGEGRGSDWERGIRYVLPSTSDDDIGRAFGFGPSTGTGSAGTQLSYTIAYSVLNEGTLVYGDTAARALFDDSGDLGNASPRLSALIDDEVRSSIGGVVAEFAGLLAFNKREQTQWSGATDGVLRFSDNNSSLLIDLTDQRWSLNHFLDDPHAISSSPKLVEAILTSALEESFAEDERNFITGELDRWSRSGLLGIDSVALYLGQGSEFQVLAASEAPLIVTTNNAENIIVNQSNAIIVTGNGADIVTTSGLNNAFVGGNDVDRLTGGTGDDWFFGGAGSDIIDGGDGTDTAVYVDDSSLAVRYDGSAGAGTLTVQGDTLSNVETVRLGAPVSELSISGRIAFGTDLTIASLSNPGNPPVNQGIRARGARSSLTFDLNRGGVASAILDDETEGQIRLENFNTTIFASDFDDTIFDGSDEDKIIFGGAGNDTISIAETLPASILIGGDGTDRFIGGHGSDVIIDQQASISDAIELEPNTFIGSEPVLRALVGSINAGFGEDDIVIDIGGIAARTFGGTRGNPGVLPPGGDPRFEYDLDPGEGNDSIQINFNGAINYKYQRGDGADRVRLSSSGTFGSSDIFAIFPVSTFEQPTLVFDFSDYDQDEVTIRFGQKFVQTVVRDKPNNDLPDVEIVRGDILIEFSDGGSVFVENVFGLTRGPRIPGNIESVDLPFGSIFRFADGRATRSALLINSALGAPEPPPSPSPPLPQSSRNLNQESENELDQRPVLRGTPVAFGSNNDIGLVESEGEFQNFVNLQGADSRIVASEFNAGEFHEVRLRRGNFAFSGSAGVDRLLIDWTLDSLAVSLNESSLIISDRWGVLGTTTLSEFDEIYVFETDETYTVQGFVDAVTARQFAPTESGSESDDAIVGTAIRDRIFGLSGNDTIDGQAADDLIHAGNGDDVVFGGEGDDDLFGEAGNDTLYGGAGNDLLDGGLGDDTLVGGSGDDTYIVDSSNDVLIELDGEGIDRVVSSVDFALPNHVEELTLVGQALEGIGDASANRIQGNDEDNILVGLGGNDILLGGGGDDLLEGGDGDDILRGQSGNNTLYGGSGNDILLGGGGDDLLDGGDGDDILRGQSGNSFLLGSSGNDTLFAGSGADILEGGDGNDVLHGGGRGARLLGGQGNDRYLINSANDFVVEAQDGGHDTVVSNLFSYRTDLHIEEVILGENARVVWVSDSGITIVGNNFGNSIFGGAGSDIVFGGSGDDNIDGGAGADEMRGGLGDDLYFIDNENDFVIEQLDEGFDTIISSINYTLGAHVEVLELDGGGAIQGTGNSLDNEIFGNEQNNILLGLEGDDTLDGFGGDDVLDGGAGIDSASFFGSLSDYDILRHADGRVSVTDRTGDEGTDTLISIENLLFYTNFDDDPTIISVAEIPLEPGNRPPVVLQPLANVSRSEDIDFLIEIPLDRFADLDGDALSLSAELADGGALPEWIAFGGATLSGRPPLDFNGSIDLAIRASDGELSVTSQFVLTIDPINDVPVILVPIADLMFNEDEAIAIDLPTAGIEDVDGDALTFTLTGAGGAPLPTWLTFANGRLIAIPTADLNGVFDLELTATDGFFAVTDAFKLTLGPVNDAPVVVAALPDVSANEGEAFAFTIDRPAFADADGETLSLTARLVGGAALPGWMAFDGTTLSGAAPRNFAGTLEVEIVASDGMASVGNAFALAILAVNEAPVLAQPLADQTAIGNSPFAVTLPANSFVDPEGDVIVYSALLADGSALPQWLSFDGTRFTAANVPPVAAQIDIRVTASDGQLSATDQFLITVDPGNTAPIANDDGVFVTTSNRALVIGAESLLANDSDREGVSLQITGVGNAAGGRVGFDADGNVIFTPDAVFVGAASFTYTVSDGVLTATATVSIDVDPSGQFDGFRQGNDSGNVMLGSLFGRNRIFGAGGNDIITGGLRNDDLAGGDGNDVLFGLLGNDNLWGGQGNDQLFGSLGYDRAFYSGSRNDYQISTTGGVFRITDIAPGIDGDDGVDQLFSVEQLVFREGETLNIASPIILDLDGNGVETISAAESNARFDLDADGLADDTSWIGAGDAFLYLDRDANGTVSGVEEISFIDDVPDAATDLAGLRAFDSNSDGILDARDERFAEFGVWRDADSDGSVDEGETASLTAIGVRSINLTGTPVDGVTEFGEVAIANTGSFTLTNGTTHSFADAALTYFSAATNLPSLSVRKYDFGPKASKFRISAAGGVLTVGPCNARSDTDPRAEQLGANTILTFRSRDYGMFAPVVFDLDGDGVELVSRKKSRASFDYGGDGAGDDTGWIGRDDGFLVIDRNNDGLIAEASELSLASEDGEARSGLQGLARLDSNGDGVVDSNDARFGELRVWQDRNGNGRTDAGELGSLEDAGIVSIRLNTVIPANTRVKLDNSIIAATTTFVRANGTTSTAADVSLAYRPAAARNSSATSLAPTFDQFGRDLFGAPFVETGFGRDILLPGVNELVELLGSASPRGVTNLFNQFAAAGTQAQRTLTIPPLAAQEVLAPPRVFDPASTYFAMFQPFAQQIGPELTVELFANEPLPIAESIIGLAAEASQTTGAVPLVAVFPAASNVSEPDADAQDTTDVPALQPDGRYHLDPAQYVVWGGPLRIVGLPAPSEAATSVMPPARVLRPDLAAEINGPDGDGKTPDADIARKLAMIRQDLGSFGATGAGELDRLRQFEPQSSYLYA